jgi:prolyl-tRNA synthetase
VGKSEAYSEWYNRIVEESGLIDKRYPIKGMNVWRPYGLQLRNNIDAIIRREMTRTAHDEVEFPLLIPKTEFAKEADHIKGFDAEVFWVTHGGLNQLDIPLAVRPTSETAMYPIFRLWIRSHTDLPLKQFQIVNTFRYETKHTRPFIRVREIHFFEAHTCHSTYEDAELQIQEDLEIWSRIAEDLCLPYVVNRRPEWDKFPGAHYSLGADVLTPELKTLQSATIHQYKTNFSKAYEIMYETPNETREYAHQTTYGMSERLVGAVVAIHGDDKGLVLPPAVAPVQVVMVPIIFDDSRERVLAQCEKLFSTIREAGIRVQLDKREETAGFKFNDWEMRGVPVRVEVGPKDVDAQRVMIVTRHDRRKVEASVERLVDAVRESLGKVQVGLKERARQVVLANTHNAKDLSEAAKFRGLVRVSWCGKVECGKVFEEKAGKSVLGKPVKELETGKAVQSACLACGESPSEVALLANTY